MRLIPIPDSTMLAAIGYDAEQEVFVAQFQNGSLYRYNGVPKDSFIATITNQDSVGRAFNAFVKDPFGQSAEKVDAEAVLGI